MRAAAAAVPMVAISEATPPAIRATNITAATVDPVPSRGSPWLRTKNPTMP